ncbi:MAG TPA: GntR family transcriptional regulator [Gaiellaceae bacterium]|jgi:DNA-binding GntR family transcriptional regulator
MAVSKVSLREQVKELVLERILDGTYQPGDRLVETRIAQELGTSQAPVREALRELESLRFVESEQFRGARVRAVSPEELAEIYPVRAALEEVAGREAAKRLRGQVRALEVELEEMRAAARDGDIHRQVEHDVRFHRLIVESAGNATLLEVWRSLRIEVRTVITLLAGGVDPAELVEMHVPVLEALRAGDPDEAGRVLRHHVEHFADLFLKANE